MSDEQTKPWWQSRTIWASIAVLVAMVIKLIAPDSDVTDADLLEVFMSIVAAVAAVIAVWGRVIANKKIG